MCCELIYNIVIVSVLVTLSLIEIHVYNKWMKVSAMHHPSLMPFFHSFVCIRKRF